MDELYRQILNELPNGELSVDRLASRLNMSAKIAGEVAAAEYQLSAITRQSSERVSQ